MPSLKDESYALTSEYIKLLMAEHRLAEAGVDAPLRDINIANQIRMNVGMADESIRHQLRLHLLGRKDPDDDINYR